MLRSIILLIISGSFIEQIINIKGQNYIIKSNCNQLYIYTFNLYLLFMYKTRCLKRIKILALTPFHFLVGSWAVFFKLNKNLLPV